jgi:hypothetical protein
MFQLNSLPRIAMLLTACCLIAIGSVSTAKADSVCIVGGTELTGSGAGSLGGVLTISAVESGGNTTFTISMAPPTGGNYTAAAFVSNIVFNVTGTPAGTTSYTIGNGGITCTNCTAIGTMGDFGVTVGNNNQSLGPFSGFDGHIDLPPPPGGDGTLQAGETIVFTVNGLTGVDLCNACSDDDPSFSVIAHIQGLGTAGQQSGHYTCTNCNDVPIPEPASMLLLGTGLIGVAGAARRRFKK